MPTSSTPVAHAFCSADPEWSAPVSSMAEAVAFAESFEQRVTLYPCDAQGGQSEDLPSCGWADPSGDYHWL